MILRSSVFHGDVVEIRVDNYDDRVEIIVRNIMSGRKVVNKHRVYGRLGLVRMDSLDNRMVLVGKNIVRFEKPAKCINIIIETVIESSSSIPSVSVFLKSCTRVHHDRDVDVLFGGKVDA